MSVTAPNALGGIPVSDGQYIVVPASGTAHVINPGDMVLASGDYILAGSGNAAGNKASSLGWALDRNPAYDWAGRQVINSGVLVARYGTFRVSAAFSGRPLLGVLAGPVTTGSGVNAPSGQTGLGATWNTATPVSVSGGTAAAPVFGYGQVVGWYNSGPAGTGQLDVVVWNRNADYY